MLKDHILARKINFIDKNSFGDEIYLSLKLFDMLKSMFQGQKLDFSDEICIASQKKCVNSKKKFDG